MKNDILSIWGGQFLVEIFQSCLATAGDPPYPPHVQPSMRQHEKINELWSKTGIIFVSLFPLEGLSQLGALFLYSFFTRLQILTQWRDVKIMEIWIFEKVSEAIPGGAPDHSLCTSNKKNDFRFIWCPVCSFFPMRPERFNAQKRHKMMKFLILEIVSQAITVCAWEHLLL